MELREKLKFTLRETNPWWKWGSFSVKGDIIMFQPGQILDVVRLSKETGLSRQAAASYLDYLEKAFLIRKLYNFSRNLRKQKRALKKYYPAMWISKDSGYLCKKMGLNRRSLSQSIKPDNGMGSHWCPFGNI